MAGIIEFLFGHTADIWTEGTFTFQAPLGGFAIAIAIAILVFVVLILYRKTTAPASVGLKTALIVLRCTALILILLALLQPIVNVSSVSPSERYIGLLVDNSRSMSVGDMHQSPSRAQQAMDMLNGEDGLIEQLQDDFTVRIFGFDRTARHLPDPRRLSFDGAKTDLAQALQHVSEAMKGLPLEGLVLITDGGNNSGEDPFQMASIINAGNTPVHVIGVGADKPGSDIEISHISTSGSIMEGGILEAQITVQSSGYEGRESQILVAVDEDVVASKTIKLGPDGMAQRYTFHLAPTQEGALVYTARIAPQSDEVITENNQLSFLVDSSEKQVEILYIEGHPRNEYKFIRRAASTDPAVRLKTLLMTGPQKILRQGIDSAMELASGYPDDDETLFTYDAVIFGDVASNFFTDEQLALTRDFVFRRGGGFLMLGGSTAFDHGFIGTPIEDLLPVTLMHANKLPPDLRGGVGRGEHATGQTFAPQLTREGRRSMIMRLELEDEANRSLWSDMPHLQGINVTGLAKPGATVLAVHPTLSFQKELLPVLAYERYGRGRTMSLMTATTWRWQMLQSHEDTSHERFWRQILHWLAASSPSPVEIVLDHDKYISGDEVSVRARVYNEAYEPVSGAIVWLKTTDPDNLVDDILMHEDIGQAGDYVASLATSKPGVYQLEVSSLEGVSQKGYSSLRFLVTESGHEMRGTEKNREVMEKIATGGGGTYHTPESAGMLVKELKNNQHLQTIKVPLELWNIPLAYLLLLFCFSLEWLLRRRRGLS